MTTSTKLTIVFFVVVILWYAWFIALPLARESAMLDDAYEAARTPITQHMVITGTSRTGQIIVVTVTSESGLSPIVEVYPCP